MEKYFWEVQVFDTIGNILTDFVTLFDLDGNIEYITETAAPHKNDALRAEFEENCVGFS